MLKSFPHYKQLDKMDCGPTCLRIIAKHYGKTYSSSFFNQKANLGREGVSMYSLAQAAEAIGLRTLFTTISFNKLRDSAPVPFIAYWRKRHFVVVYGFSNGKVLVSDPAHGLLKITEADFISGWSEGNSDDGRAGRVLFLETTPKFFDQKETGLKTSISAAIRYYLLPHKKAIRQLLIGIFLVSVLQVIFPFLTQSVVDVGIKNKNLNFITIIFFAQLALFVGRTVIEFIRGWVVLTLNSKINAAIISDYLDKLIKLPISYFDSKMSGDILQRLNDHKKIDQFMTGTTVNVVFSIFTFLVFSIILLFYEPTIFFAFIGFSVVYIIWTTIFLKRRSDYEYQILDKHAENQNDIIQLIQGMQELKMNNSALKRKWAWYQYKIKTMQLTLQSLVLTQYQTAGGNFINEVKNILISFMSATLVINGDITMGMMLSIQYIIGQLNSPVNQFITVINASQDARISLERLTEIEQIPNESDEFNGAWIKSIQPGETIKLENIHFNYPGVNSKPILKGLNIEIEGGKVTAIVGSSGSGKTTLLKILLRFYNPTSGRISLGNSNFTEIDPNQWRAHCSAVLQDGYIFSEDIAYNIGISDLEVNIEKLNMAIKMSRLEDVVSGLAQGLRTKVGMNGSGLSQGQKQRILIARAIYKSGDYIFFDEATNSLDSVNENEIVQNLNQVFKGRTVVVVAHRLSTVKNADRIIVLDKGAVVECGTHHELVELQGHYFNLVKNQLELERA